MTRKKLGRPATPSYTKKQYRYASVEKRFLKVIEQMESEHDKKLVLKALEEMKTV